MKRIILFLLFAFLAVRCEAYQIKQSTTAYPLVFFMADSSDHVTAKTGLFPTVTISKAGGSFASPSGTVTEIANGWYKVAGNATDSATLGPLVLHATGSGADPTDAIYEVVAFDPQDTVRLGLTAMPNVASGNSGALLVDGTGTAALSVSGGRGKADVTYWNASAVASPDTAGYPKVTIKDGTGTGEVNTNGGYVFSDLTKILGTTLAESSAGNLANNLKTFLDNGDNLTAAVLDDIATIKTKTGYLPSATAGASGGLLISGSNSGTTTLGALTVTGTTTMSDGLVVNRSTSNGTAATFTGNGLGAGVKMLGGSGAGSNAFEATSQATNGSGAVFLGTGNGSGVRMLSGTGATGSGLVVTAQSTNGPAALLTGAGTGAGLAASGASGGTGPGALFSSGTGATGNGVEMTAASTNGSGLKLLGTGTGVDLNLANDEFNWTGGGGGLTAQQVRDAMKLAPTAGASGSGSIDDQIADIQADLDAAPTLATAANTTEYKQVIRDAMKLAASAGAAASESIDDKIDDIGVGAAAQGQVDNSRVAPRRVLRLSDRSDGTYGVERPARMKAGEPMTWWVDMSPLTGESWIDDVDTTPTSSDATKITATAGMNRELLALHIDATNAVAGQTYTITGTVEVGGSTVTVVVEVRIAAN